MAIFGGFILCMHEKIYIFFRGTPETQKNDDKKEIYSDSEQEKLLNKIL